MKIRLSLLAAFYTSGLLLAQQAAPPPSQGAVDNGLLIQTETKMVLVDAVVTDKKGEYVRDLKVKDFKVSEDGKEQPIKTFSFEAEPAPGTPERTHYLVLVFDNSTMNPGDQVRAREAATKFIDTNAGPNRMMAVVNFGGVMQVAQNFTGDVPRLKAVVSGQQFSAVSPNDKSAGGGPNSNSSLARVAMDFAARDMLQTLRSLAKSLGPTPGRKSLILFTTGFKLTNEQIAEVTATVDECNRQNVAIYPVDVRGLSTQGTGMKPIARLQMPAPQSVFQTVAFTPKFPFVPQRGGTTGGGTVGGGTSTSGSRSSSPSAPSGTVSGSTGPTSTGRGNPSTSTLPNSNPGGRAGTAGGANVPNPGMGGCGPGGGLNGGGPGAGGGGQGAGLTPGCQSRNLIPKIPDTATANQEVMFMLASGTGGFVIHDSNDLLGGLEKIGKEQNQYYILGYTPPDTKEGSCHVLKVKVDRSGVEVRARSGYCSAKPMDVLAGNPMAKTLEAKLAAAQPGKVAASMRLPFFYTSPNVARVNLAMEISPDALKFDKKKGGGLHSEVNFLGVAYTPEGTVAARFSDTLKLDANDKTEADDAKLRPLHYENQFDIAAGKYTFKIVYTESGDSFGKLEMPLEVESYKEDVMAVSGLALSKEYHRTSDLGGSLDAALLQDRTPLIADGIQIVPTGSSAFAKSDLAIMYFEFYDPLLVSADPKNPPLVGFRIRVLDRKTGEQKQDTGVIKMDPQPPLGRPVVPVGGKMPVSGLAPGAYKLEVTVLDSANNTALRTTDFEIQ